MLLLIEHLVTVIVFVRFHLGGLWLLVKRRPVATVSRPAAATTTDRVVLVPLWLGGALEVLQVFVAGRVIVMSAVASILCVRKVIRLVSAGLADAGGRAWFGAVAAVSTVLRLAVIVCHCGVSV